MAGKVLRCRWTKTTKEYHLPMGSYPRRGPYLLPLARSMSRPLILATLLGASIGVPYAVTHSPLGSDQGGQPFSAAGQSSSTSPQSSYQVPPINSPGSLLYQSPVPIEGVPFRSLAEVLRFDITKEWIYRNWARKSTGLADPEMYGVRVPLVTGTGMSDLAGSLTYYFNSQGQVQHIAFFGRTADTTQLVQFLTRTYKFQRVEAPAGEQLYQVQYNGRVQSELRTRPESVLWTTSPHGSFVVELALERPGSSRTLPPRGPQLPAQTTAPPVDAHAAAGDSAQDADSEGGMMKTLFPEGARYATPEEQEQVLWQRWPN